MFTGIIKEMGVVDGFTPSPSGGGRLVIRRPDADSNLQRGESLAVNGVCLTALPGESGTFVADLSPETLDCTNLGALRPGVRVNLERAMRLEDRLSGHIVQGHVDAVGNVVEIRHEGDFAVYRWSYPEEFGNLVVAKGSIAVDGISLTIIDPDAKSFGVALIPETIAKTNLGESQIGDKANLEFDIMAKLVERLVAPYLAKLRA
jgi:riboflavin synthase